MTRPRADERVDQIRHGFDLDSRVTVTQLGRSTAWRKALSHKLALEVVDRNRTAAVLLQPEAYTALLEYLDHLEAELEQAQVEALFARRESLQQWLTGDALEQSALTRLAQRRERIRELLDGHS
ncbi:MAG: hypothetical protein K6U87_13160 [Firmicutes bacterium]|nr:hypothetical protein [Bacillota bacterium]